MSNIFWGLVIIAIGLVRGDSIFYGDFTVLPIIFDGLGLFWLGKGVLSLVNGKNKAAS